MGALVDPFAENLFMQRALMAGVLVAVSCAVAGTFVVLRGLAFMGDALAHGVLPGVAAALLVGGPGILGAAVGAAAMIAGVSLITNRSRLSSDTAIGLLFVGLLALGVVIVSRSPSFSGDLVRILFGEVLGIRTSQLWFQAAATAGIVAAAALFVRPFLLLSFDADAAEVAGYRARRYHLGMLALVAATVIASFQTVGTLLVFGMLLAPAGAAALVSRRIGPMIALAATLGSLSVYAGLLLSYHADLAAGASVVLVSVTLFFVVFTTQAVRLRHVAASG